MSNNLNSAGALAELDKVVGKSVPDDDFVKFLDDAFGLGIAESTQDIADDLKAKIAERFEAKKARDFAKADVLRDEIEAMGLALLDGADGSIWQYAN